MLKVLKFGGSSLADAQQFAKVKAIVEADESRRVVIVSAPGKRFSGDHKITDLLYLCAAHIKYGVSCEEIFDMIRTRYLEIAHDCGLKLDLNPDFDALWAKMQEGIEKDELASRGEYFSARLMAEYLGYEFLDAAEWVKFRFDGTVDTDATYEALRRAAGDRSVVIPGFYGVMPDGRIRTFSRGGSDVTGSIVAGAVKASLYENWTDVSGFLVADPRIVDDPAVIRTITYTELRELSYMGASVLHEAAIFPVRSAGIPINIRNTNAPEEPGTMIVPDSTDEELSAYTITGIAGKKDFTSINIHKDLMNSQIGFCRDVLNVLSEHQIPLEHMPSSIDSMTVIVDSAHLNGLEEEIRTEIIKAVQPDSIETEDGIALIAVVGRGMCRTRGVAARIFAALAHAHINVRMIDQGSSELNVIVAVKETDFEQAIRCIYDMFVNSVA